VPLLHRYVLARTGSRSRAEEVGTACGGGATSGGPCELNAAAGRGANSGLDRGRYRPTTAGAVDRRAINSRARCQHRRPVVGAVALFARARQRPPHLSLSLWQLASDKELSALYCFCVKQVGGTVHVLLAPSHTTLPRRTYSGTGRLLCSCDTQFWFLYFYRSRTKAGNAFLCETRVRDSSRRRQGGNGPSRDHEGT
jgi:hypothetical protein